MPRRRKTAINFLTGGSYNFYEPDKKLSQQISMDGARSSEIGIRETAWD